MSRPKKKSMDEVNAERKAAILERVDDCVQKLLYSDREDDKEISSALLFEMLDDKSVINTLDIIKRFAAALRKEVE